LPIQGDSQEKEVTTTETVSVINVEVPVRVFHRGTAVDNLKKSDFKIYEKGELQTIHGFYINRKKINQINSESIIEAKRPLRPARYFVLAFRIIKYNQQLQKGIDYIFDNILRRNDQLLIFANNRSLFLKKLSNLQKCRKIVKKLIEDECRKARHRLIRYLKKIETEMDLSRINQMLSTGSYQTADEIINFLRKYLHIWEEYKRNYLVPNMDSFYYFARHLEKIQKEKWVINFYQIELFPKLKISGSLMKEIRDLIGSLQGSLRSEDNVYAKTMASLLINIDKALNTSLDFPAEDVSKLFYKVNTTFHSILIPINRDILSQDLEYKRISTEIENSLREITKKTGGSLITSGNLESALNKIQEKKDIVYMLTYVPKRPEKIGKIKVVTNKKNYKVLYDDQMRKDYIKAYLINKKLEIPIIRIDKLSFEEKKLRMFISNFLIKSIEKENHGNINIQIQILDNHNNKVYNQNKNITTKQNNFSISVGFPWLKKGRYDIILQITDLFTGKSVVDYIQPTID